MARRKATRQSAVRKTKKKPPALFPKLRVPKGAVVRLSHDAISTDLHGLKSQEYPNPETAPDVDRS